MTLFDNGPRNAVVIATTTTLALVASLFFLNSRKKKVKNVLTRESFINNRNLSWFQLAPAGDDIQGDMTNSTKLISSMVPFHIEPSASFKDIY